MFGSKTMLKGLRRSFESKWVIIRGVIQKYAEKCCFIVLLSSIVTEINKYKLLFFGS